MKKKAIAVKDQVTKRAIPLEGQLEGSQEQNSLELMQLKTSKYLSSRIIISNRYYAIKINQESILKVIASGEAEIIIPLELVHSHPAATFLLSLKETAHRKARLMIRPVNNSKTI